LLIAGIAALGLVLTSSRVVPAQVAPDQAADMLLTSARRAYNDKNYAFAVEKFREFLTKYGSHKEVADARYGLALALIDGPAKDYQGAAEQLLNVVAVKEFADRPFALYYLGLSQRGLGVKELSLAAAKPNEAEQHKNAAKQRFEEAAKQFAAAADAFAERPKPPAADAKELPADLEWATRARCDVAEMHLRLQKPKEALAAVRPVLADKALAKSRYHAFALYLDGFSNFLLDDRNAAGRSLTKLAPYTDPVFGTHARYFVARLHHLEGERPEALGDYEGVIGDYSKAKLAAAEALKQPDRFKNDPEEKARLEALVKDSPPDHVARATFYLGVMQYEDGKFAEAVTRLAAFTKQFPASPLTTEAQLRTGFCQVQLKQWAEAPKTLQPLADKEPRLADQCLLWIGKAQIGSAADAPNPQAAEQALKAGIETLRRAAEKAGKVNDPEAKTRRAEILLETADAQHLVKQHKEAAAVYQQILNEKTLPARDEELTDRLIQAQQLSGDYAASDKTCEAFRDRFPKSTLLPSVLFRYAENAYFSSLNAEKVPNPQDREREVKRLTEEAIKRYAAVVDKYPDFAHTNLARYGLAMALYRKGDLEKAKEKLEAIPAPDRTGDLALVPYQLADVLIRLAPAKADDAIANGKLEEAMKAAIEQLDGFIAGQPNGPHAPDAYLKLGHCHQRLATVLAKPEEQQKEIAAARSAYKQLQQKFAKSDLVPQATFERAKCLSLAKDDNGAINELRHFQNDPLKNSTIAPMALLHLATLLRGQNKAAEAVSTLDQCRKAHEANLLKDPSRAGWAPLLQYHHAVALREAGKRAEARALFDQIMQQSPDRPEAAEAALRSGQCLKDDARQKLQEGVKKLATPNLKPEEQAAARKQIEDATKEVRDAVLYLASQAEKLREKQPTNEARARMLYEGAWGCRLLADQEVQAARTKIQQEQWQKRKDEVAKKTPPGHQPPFVPMPDVPLSAVPVQPSEQQARVYYNALIEAFPDVAANADARFELAELLSERGEHDSAVKLLRSALDKEPAQELTDKIRIRLGAALMAKGDAKAALTQFNLVAQNAKSTMYPQAMYRAGEALMAQGDPAEAVKKFAVFRDVPQFQNQLGLTDRAMVRLGHAQAALKQWDASRQAHEQVVNRFGNGVWAAEARYGIGWAYQNQGQFDTAVAAYTQVVSATTTELGAKAQFNIGLCRLAQKRYPEATTALLVVPFTYDYPNLSALALVEAARALAEDKQPDQAIKLLERVLRDHPDTESAEVAKKRLEALKKG
jgi:TolA-binding protein